MNVAKVDPGDRGRVAACARLMADSEPWITLQRSYESAMTVLRDPAREVHVVTGGDGEVRAFVVLDLRGPLAGYIQTVCVHPEHRGQGLGTQLIRWAEDLIARESPNVFICVPSFNDAARRLYERLGYELVGQLTNFIVHGHDELLLRKTSGSWNDFRRP